MLEKGVGKYPSNPVLLYLSALARESWQDDMEGQQLLERAAALDPEYMDPWYGLVITHLARGDRENADAALRRLLTGRAVEDEVMDFSYNMLTSLDSNAILITNGDNDTYPGWILTRIIRYRPDVKIVNRSLLNTDWYDVDFGNRLLHVQSSIFFKTKGGRRRAVPMNEMAFSVLWRRAQSNVDRGVFLVKGRTIRGDLIVHKFKRYVREAGLDPKLHFHSLRHTFATWLIQEGISIYEVQKLLGHSNITVTQVYAHLASQELHRAVDKIVLTLN